MKTTELTPGKWAGILANLGVDHHHLTGKHTDCPLCGGKDRFRFDDKEGRGTYYCNNCGAGDGWRLAMGYTGLNFKELASKIDGMVGNIQESYVSTEQKRDPKIRLRKLGSKLKPALRSSYVVRYLASRGIDSKTISEAKNLKGCDSWGYYEDGQLIGNYSVMVGLIQNENPLTYHTTYLEDGEKASVPCARKMLTPVSNISGGAIRLFDYEDALGIAEGIETALSAYQLDGIPTWAAVNENGVKTFEAPKGVKSLFIYGDNDRSFVGQSAAYELAKRYAKKLPVFVKIPHRAGQDWNDVLRAS